MHFEGYKHPCGCSSSEAYITPALIHSRRADPLPHSTRLSRPQMLLSLTFLQQLAL